MGRRSKKIYWVNYGHAMWYVFIHGRRGPEGCWYLCRPLVLVTSCTVCGATPGEPCRRANGLYRGSSVHEIREDAFTRGLARGEIQRPRPPSPKDSLNLGGMSNPAEA